MKAEPFKMPEMPKLPEFKVPGMPVRPLLDAFFVTVYVIRQYVMGLSNSVVNIRILRTNTIIITLSSLLLRQNFNLGIDLNSFYRGGFETAMTRREASQILGVRYAC